jgi:hypothetical protein
MGPTSEAHREQKIRPHLGELRLHERAGDPRQRRPVDARRDVGREQPAQLARGVLGL